MSWLSPSLDKYISTLLDINEQFKRINVPDNFKENLQLELSRVTELSSKLYREQVEKQKTCQHRFTNVHERGVNHEECFDCGLTRWH